AFQKARQQQKPTESRQELGRDKSKSLFVLVGVCVVLLLIFFAVFSHPKKKIPLPGENPRGEASLGRKVTPGQENNDPTKSATPMLSADVRSSDPALDGQLTAEDIGRTSRTGMVPKPTAASSTSTKTNPSQDYALSKVDFSDPTVGQGTTVPNPPSSSSSDSTSDLKKPSLVFVRSTETKPMMKPNSPEDTEEILALAAGTRLVARLQTPVSSAVATPVVAVVEYNYERNGQIVLAAGSKVFGRLAQVNPSGYMGIQFNRVEMPDGTVEKIDASAMSLNFGPLKGDVSGKKTGTKFLVRSLTGLGTMASYLVGPQGSTSEGMISPNTLMRERLADNVATAGQEELNGLAFNQNLVVTLPGNTRFYIVVQKPASDHTGATPGARNTGTSTAGFTGGVPTLEELRQLMQLRGEINELYTQAGSQAAIQPQPQQ
ncbi:MAG TPA: TrbI/VirB10 family protein, partial [Candidatus Angelobacter sp.]|nr:TrbI/VirB10 family protein [Candidatus Angelobacter sp.]